MVNHYEKYSMLIWRTALQSKIVIYLQKITLLCTGASFRNKTSQWNMNFHFTIWLNNWHVKHNIGKEKCYKQHWKNPTKILNHNLQFCKMEVFPHVCVFKSKTSPSISLNSGLIFLNNWPTQTATFNVTTKESFNCHASNIPEIRLLEF